MNELAILAFVAVPAVAVLGGYIAVRLNERAGASLKRQALEAERVEHAAEMMRPARS